MTRILATPGRDERRDERGFTLVELMISLLLFSFAVAGVLSVAVSITQGFREQRQAINAEAAVRAPLDFIADALRQASPGVPGRDKITDYHTCKQGGISVTNSSTGPDDLDLFYASGGVVTTLTEEFNSSSTSLKVNDASQLSPGDYVIVTNLTVGFLVKLDSPASGNTFPVSNKCTGSPALSWPSGNFPAGSIVVRAQHARFYIYTINGVPTLMMDPSPPLVPDDASTTAEPLAENIEDMQIAIGIDANSDKTLTEGATTVLKATDEWHYNVASDSTPGTLAIRGVRLTLIARTSSTLFGNVSTSLFARPAIEDRTGGAADSYRRRTLRTIVELRNIGDSP